MLRSKLHGQRGLNLIFFSNKPVPSSAEPFEEEVQEQGARRVEVDQLEEQLETLIIHKLSERKFTTQNDIY